MPITAEDCLVSRFQIAGIIRNVEPLPMPVAANTNRNATRNHGNIAVLSSAIAGSAVGFGVSRDSVHEHAEGARRSSRRTSAR